MKERQQGIMQRTRKEKSMQRAELIARQKEIFERHQEKVKQDSIKEQLLSRTPDLLLGNGSLKDTGRRVTTQAIVRKQEAATRRLSNFGGQKSGGRLGKAVRKWGAISAFSNKKKSPNPFFRQPAEHPGYGSNATADGNVACPEEEEEDRNDTEGEDCDDNDDARQGSGGRRRPPQTDSTNRKTSAKQTQKARKSPRQSRAGTSGRGKSSPGTAKRPHTAYSSHSISASPHFRENKGDAAAAVMLGNEQEPGFADELNSLYISARYRLRSAQKERRSVFQMRPSTTPLRTSPRAPRHELRGTQRGRRGGASNGGGARTSSPMRSKAHVESDSSPPRTSGRPQTVGGKGRRTKPTANYTRQPPHQQQTHHPHPPHPPRPPPVPRRPMTSPREPSAGKFHAPVAFGGFGGRGGVGGATPLQRRTETATTQNESKKKKTLKKKIKKKKKKTKKTTPNNQSATPKGAPLTPWDDDGGSRRNSNGDDDDGDYAQQPRQCYSSNRSDESEGSGGVHGEEEGGASEQPQSNTWIEAAAGNAPRSSFSQLLEELVHQERGGEARPGHLITLIDELLEKDHA